jgi:predicted nucleotidyltransferase
VTGKARHGGDPSSRGGDCSDPGNCFTSGGVTPTTYPELNAVLRELVSSAQTILSENFCGAYLQGSFAFGEADEHSDVDFLIVTIDELSDAQLGQIQSMHSRVHAIEVPWAQHLEGSYVPKESLRTVDASHSAYLFLDNGASELIWDDHCNTAVTRWILREHGIVLAGPDPKSLVDPVSAEQLRSEALVRLHEYTDWASEPETEPMSRWMQPYLVLTFCRILHTVKSARVVSKREAAEWAIRALDPEWARHIQRALEERADPWLRVHQSADAELVDRTRAFADYVAQEAGSDMS